jgi:hypothetical protein
MYCPNCGAESTVGFKYCKRCGGNLTETAQAGAPVVQSAKSTVAAMVLAVATVAIALGGLGITFTHALSLIGPSPPGYSAPVQDASVIAGMVVAFGSATVAFIAFLLIGLFSRVMGLPSASEPRPKIKKPAANEYKPAQLPSPPPSVASVTEHTTRTFRPPVYDEANTRD